MSVSRVSQETKQKIKLVQKELERIHPKFKGLFLSEDYLINRAIDYYLLDSPYKEQK